MPGDTPRRERKVVTVVFCDLVGFTSRAEAMDPEDVDALLRPYHERVRAELERRGGTVEKFIGRAASERTTGIETAKRPPTIGRPAELADGGRRTENLSSCSTSPNAPGRSASRGVLTQAERFGDAAQRSSGRERRSVTHGSTEDGTRRLATRRSVHRRMRESPHVLEANSRQFPGHISLARGRPDEALERLRVSHWHSAARNSSRTQNMAPASDPMAVGVRPRWVGSRSRARAGGGAALSEGGSVSRGRGRSRRSRRRTGHEQPRRATHRGDGCRSSTGTKRCSLSSTGRFRGRCRRTTGRRTSVLFEAEKRTSASRQAAPASGRRPRIGSASSSRRRSRSPLGRATLFVERGERLLAGGCDRDERQRRERKVVTVVFCDLVGFTARAESLDPEDVEAILRPYHERVRAELERHGGTVEKFIGDAVMALFGAPTAHEDDPERAVRAALAIRDFARRGGARAPRRDHDRRGARLARRAPGRRRGHGVGRRRQHRGPAADRGAGQRRPRRRDDVSRDASRDRLRRAPTPVEAKGKAEPIAVWQATRAQRASASTSRTRRARSSSGASASSPSSSDAFDRARHARDAAAPDARRRPRHRQEPARLRAPAHRRGRPELITWRQGRCLAYGDGVTLWALAEIVKAQAGIARAGLPAEVAEKLARAAVDALPEGRRAWVESHLLALVGLAAEAELGGNRRNEAFSAWRRFLEGARRAAPARPRLRGPALGGREPARLRRRARRLGHGRPAARRRTARPELLERRPGWGGGKLNAATLALAPLYRRADGAALGSALGTPVLAAETQAALLERAGGNPLYAEQFAELYVERGSTDELPLPETLQGIIAARLDGLAPDEKSLMLDAAVVGKVFWTGALGRDETTRPPRSTRSSGRGSSGGSGARRSRADRARVRARARSRRRVRPDPARRPGCEAPPRGRVDRVARATGGPRRDARVPLGLRARARARRGRRRRPRRPRAARAARRGRPRVRAQQLRGRGGAVRGRPRALAGGRPGASRAALPLRAAHALGVRRGSPAGGARDRARRVARVRRYRTRGGDRGLPRAHVLGSRAGRRCRRAHRARRGASRATASRRVGACSRAVRAVPRARRRARGRR